MDKLNFTIEKNALRGKLMMRGETLASWAKANGYKKITVHTVVRKYWGHPNPPICGILTSEILKKLKAEIEPPPEATNGV